MARVATTQRYGKRKYTDEAIVEALNRTKGLVYLAAENLGCDPSTIFRRANVSENVASAIKRARGRMVDLAEAKLWKLINDENPTAILFFLKTQAKDRGYVERTEVVQIPSDVKSLMDALGIDDPSTIWAPLKASLQAEKDKRELLQ